MQAHDAAPDIAPLCEVPWGICPDHGPTVTSSAGRSWCHFPGCNRRWAYDRLDQPCAELATHKIIDHEGGSITACAVHAAEATQQIDGAVIEPLH